MRTGRVGHCCAATSCAAAMASARKAGAKDKAAYEFYASQVYLQLAREANKDKAYPEAKAFAEKSQTFSRQAFEKSGGGVK